MIKMMHALRVHLVCLFPISEHKHTQHTHIYTYSKWIINSTIYVLSSCFTTVDWYSDYNTSGWSQTLRFHQLWIYLKKMLPEENISRWERTMISDSHSAAKLSKRTLFANNRDVCAIPPYWTPCVSNLGCVLTSSKWSFCALDQWKMSPFLFLFSGSTCTRSICYWYVHHR